MGLKAEAFQPQRDPLTDVEDAVPIIIPMSMWEVLIHQAEIENCAPGEVLDRALCQYLEANGNERMEALKAHIEGKGQSVAQNGDRR
jgi:hypothetical protein